MGTGTVCVVWNGILHPYDGTVCGYKSSSKHPYEGCYIINASTQRTGGEAAKGARTNYLRYRYSTGTTATVLLAHPFEFQATTTVILAPIIVALLVLTCSP